MDIDAATPNATCIYAHTDAVANITVDGLYGIWVDMNDPGTACNRYFCFNLDMDNDSAPAGESGVMRFRNSGTRSLDCIFQIEANNPASHLFTFTTASLPYHSSNVSVQDGRIAVKVAGTTKYLATYAS